MIEVHDLVKIYKPMRMTRKDKADLKSSQGSKRAVDSISFTISAGEIIGYIGPNGAGKSTTIKMLTGILYPTSGTIQVFGKEPYKHRRENASNIGALFGQRSQLWPDLPMRDTFRLHRTLYDVDKTKWLAQQNKLVELLELGSYIDKPVRQLSLGERMRGELALAMMHEPKILYLDEPTIGMDILVKERIRKHLLEINRQEGVTVMLTSHDLAEVERTCQRVMVINKGKLLYDGTMEALRTRCEANSIVTIQTESLPAELQSKLRGLEELDNGRFRFIMNRSKGEYALLSELYANARIFDLVITEPPIEDVIRGFYTDSAGDICDA